MYGNSWSGMEQKWRYLGTYQNTWATLGIPGSFGTTSKAIGIAEQLWEYLGN